MRRLLIVLAKLSAKEIRMNRIAIVGIASLLLLPGISRATPIQASTTASATVSAGDAGSQDRQGVPRLVQFNGTLRDAAARPVNGVSSVTFSVYAEQDGGDAQWTETQNVLADANGHFTVLLGTATSGGFPSELVGTGQSRWLGVTIARQSEMPRVLLASVPYALKAGDADTLGGLPASSYVTTQQLAASNARPATTLLSGGGSTIVATPGVAASGAAAGPTSADAAQTSITQTTPSGTGTTDYIPLWTSGSNLGNSLLFQSSGKLGVGTTTPAATLDINGGQILRGGFYEYPQATATASTGQPSHSFQWDASVFDSSTESAVSEGFGFRAMPQNNNTSNPAASLDLFYGVGGPTGSLKDLGLSISSKGIVTFVPGQTFPESSANLNQIILPDTTSATNGVIQVGNAPFITDYASPLNVFVGGFAGGGGAETSASTSNSALGYESMFRLTSGSANSAVGRYSLDSDTTGTGNSAIGYSALQANTDGGDNVALGFYAGETNTTGTYNTLIGAGADVGAPGLSNAAAFGAYAIVGASNSLVLGGTGTYGVNVGIGTTTPQSTLELNSANSTISDPPSPILMLTNTAGGAGANVALDFNTSAPGYGLNYNPGARILALDEGGFTDTIAFQANMPGGPNSGLATTMAIHSNGNVEVYGDLKVDGNLAKMGGSFKIDDPIDPANKYLSHSFVESPDMKNIYDGVVVLDSHGEAVVELPEYFGALNRDYRYTLTAIGVAAPKLHIAAEVSDNRFKIAGGKKGMKVSWQVTGIRQDAWANAHRIPNEEEKLGAEQGHYLHPELFGAGPEQSVANAHGSVQPVANAAAPNSNLNQPTGQR